MWGLLSKYRNHSERLQRLRSSIGLKSRIIFKEFKTVYFKIVQLD